MHSFLNIGILFVYLTLKTRVINTCYAMHLLSSFNFPKPDKTGKRCLHREAGWHSYCGLSCFVVTPDWITLWSLNSEENKKQQKTPPPTKLYSDLITMLTA